MPFYEPSERNSKLALFSCLFFWICIAAAITAVTLWHPDKNSWLKQLFYALEILNIAQVILVGWIYRQMLLLVVAGGIGAGESSGVMRTARGWAAFLLSLVYIATILLIGFGGVKYMHFISSSASTSVNQSHTP